ncbi:MAG: alpha-2-macroglobulin family protein [Candidatus Riflebacteria bacterium]|nr:alpha-2-macroglobulin family protein [Candidatus Riflebacteria bacterium]
MLRKGVFVVLAVICMIAVSSGIAFADSALELSSSFSLEGALQPTDWRLKLEFSLPVSSVELSKRLKCRFNKGNLNYRIFNVLEHGEKDHDKPLPSERKVFIVGPEKLSQATGTLEITIGKGLQAADKSASLAADSILSVKTQNAISMTGSEAYFDSISDKGILIDLTHNVRDYRLKKHVRIFPSIGYFTVDRQYYSNRNAYKVSGKFVTGRKYEIRIAGGEVEGESQLLNNGRAEFVCKGPEPQISFTADRSVLELRSLQMVPLSFTSIGNFRAQLMRVPAFFGAALDSLTAFPEAEEKRPVDSSAMRIDASIDREIKKRAAEIDNMMVKFVQQHEALKQVAADAQYGDLKNFLEPAFSSDSQAFMGSDDPDREFFFSLPLDYRPEPEKGGSVVVKVSETESADGQSAARLFQITDYSLTYKFSARELLLWLTSLETGRPVADVPVMLLTGDGRSYFPGRTSHEGLLKIDEKLEYPWLMLKNNTPEKGMAGLKISDLVIAAVAGTTDSCFIKLNSNRFYSSAVQQAAPDQLLNLSKRGHVFTERGVYRPGEKVFWKATIRDFVDKSIVSPEGLSVEVSITNPRGDLSAYETLELNEFGTCSGTFEVKTHMPLGQYNIRIVPADDEKVDGKTVKRDPRWNFLMNRPEKAPETNNNSSSSESDESTKPLLAGTGFQVQEFEPPRHFVELAMTTEKRKIRQIVGKDIDQLFLNCRVGSSYYTGGPLRHSKVQWTAYLTERNAEVSKYPLFHFGNSDGQRELIESGNSVLSKDGELVVSLPVSQAVMSGLNSIEISATVLDIDGRPATLVKSFSPDPTFRVGIMKLPSGLTSGQEIPLQVIVLDKNSNKITQGEVQLEIMRKRYIYTQKRDASGAIFYHWSSGWVRNHVARQIIADGAATFELILPDGGDYMLRASCRNGNEESLAAMTFEVGYSYDSYEDYNNRSRTRSENEVILMPDRSVAAVNDKIRIRYSLPRPCEYALMTMECDDILSARVVKLDKAQGEFVETMTEACRPNVFIGLLAPATRSGFPLYASQVDSEYPRTYFGFTSIKVQNNVEAINVAIAPELPGELSALPGAQQKIDFVVTDRNNRPANAEVAVCVVDEAVLSLTGYSTPVLSALTDFLLPLCVYTGDLRTSLISQDLFKLISTRALTGGDQGAGTIASDLDARRDFRPVAFWHPAMIPDASGRFSIEFKLPDSMTSYRIYAVAADKTSGFGSKDRQLKVSREFYIEPGLPSFLTAGDKAVFPVAMHNKGNKTGTAEVRLAEAKNLTVAIPSGNVELAPFTNGRVKVNLDADNGAGEGSILLAGQFSGLNDAIERKLPVNTASTQINRQISGSFTKDQQLKPEVPAYVAAMSRMETEGALQARLNLSLSPFARLSPALKYLMRYPYGCVEQTSSAIIPLAAMRGLIKDGRLPGFTLQQVDNFLEKGFSNLLKMQTGSGGFSYWPSERRESWWGTQYAILALTLADRAGYPIDRPALDRGLDYLNRWLFSANNTGAYERGIMALSAVNLAMNKKLKAADLDIMKGRFARTESESSPLLLWAEALVGETAIEELEGRAAQLKPSDRSISQGWYYSSARQDAFILLAQLAVNSDRKVLDNLAGRLLTTLSEKGYWSSTADTGIALFALSEYFSKMNPGNEKELEISLATSSGTRQLKLDRYGQVIDLASAELMNSEGVKLVSSGNSLVNYSLEYSYPDQPSRVEAVNNGFSVEKTFENLNGKKEFRLGDLVKVTVTFEDDIRKDGRWAYFSNLALEDPIPAGFTPVNSSLKNDALPSDASSEDEEYYCDYSDGAYTFYANHQEMRKDKLLAFRNHFWSGRFKLVYYLRAICEGTFKMKPTQISLMYNPEIIGMSVPAMVTVLPAE